MVPFFGAQNRPCRVTAGPMPMVRLLRLNKNLDAKGLQNPGVDEAERDAVNIGHGVGGQGGQALDDNLSKVGCDDGGHQGDEQTVDDAGDNGAAATAHCIGKDGGGTTGEEIGHDAGDDHGQTEKGPQEHADDGANGGEDEAVNDGIGCEGEQNRAVKCGTGTGDDLLCNAIEGGNQLGDEQTNTGEQNEQANAEGDTLEDSEDDVVLSAGGFRYYLGTGQDGKQHIEGNHDGGDCKVGIIQEGQLGAELGILGGFGNIAGQLGNAGTENITQSTEVTKSDIIAAGDLADEGLCHGREYDAADTTQDGTDADGETVAEAAKAHTKENAGHSDVNGRFTIEEDIFELGEAGQNQVYHKDAGINQSYITADDFILHGNSQNCFDGRDSAINAEAGSKPYAEGFQSADDYIGARRQNHKAHHGLECSA